ncbi:MAG: UDP-N-acetylmuramoyl-L-alanine--D-glutamate ligase [bacterium]|nr:UDP-N-acetylmuramoyl-L-alanine--D-glutamate ligase [bacterium]
MARRPVTDVRRRRFAVVGAGVEGTSAARWLARHGAAVTVCDRRTRAALGPVIRELGDYGVTDFRLGPRHADRFTDFDVVVRTQSRPYRDPRIQQAIRRGVAVTSVTKLFFERCPAPIIGVTGTKGKGTTASLIAKLLKAAGKRTYLGGNIGMSPLDFLDRLRPDDHVVLELSSFQLQDLTQSPAITVVTNVTADHLDHHASVREYRSAKRAITRYQRRTDLAILNADDPGSRPFADDLGRVWWFSGRNAVPRGASVQGGWVVVRGRRMVRVADIAVPGTHNLRNVLAASLVADALGIGPQVIAKAVKRFRGLPYHFEYIGTRKGVRYLNDSYATNPTAAIPAIESVDTPLVLIVGGAKKGLPYDELARTILTRNVRALITIPPEGARIARAVRTAARRSGKPVPPITAAARKSDLIRLARRHAEPGDTVLFSPAAASFGWFPNYTERGRYFTEQVKAP